MSEDDSDLSSVIDLSFFSKEEELKRRQQRVDAIDLLLNSLDPQEKAMLVARKSFLNIMNLIKVQEQSPIIPSYYPEEGDDASTCPLPPSPKRRRRQ